MNILINRVVADQQKYAHSSLTIFYVLFLKSDGAEINECNKYYFNPREQLSERTV